MFNNPRAVLKQYHLKPKKYLGQNFLVSLPVLKKVMAAADLRSEDTVLEIGPGVGSLTWEISRRVKKVVAIEKDKGMVDVLARELKECSNVEIIQADIRKLNFQLPKNYKVVANLPFYIASPVIRLFLEAENPPSLMVLLVQKEVGQRICAKPPKMNLLAVFVQFYAQPKIIATVSKKAFWPQPKVDGAILQIAPRLTNDESLITIDKKLFAKIVKAGFSHPRKQLINNFQSQLKLPRAKMNYPARRGAGYPFGLRRPKSATADEGRAVLSPAPSPTTERRGILADEIKIWLAQNKIQPSQRAETLTVEDWISLTKNFNKLT